MQTMTVYSIPAEMHGTKSSRGSSVLSATANGYHTRINQNAYKRQYAGRRARVQLVANRKGVAPAGNVLRDLVDFSNMLPTSALRAADPQQSEEPHDLCTSRKFFN